MSTVEELKKKLATLEAAHKHNQVTAQLLMQELANGAVPCSELQRYNNIAKMTYGAQFKIWAKLAISGAIVGNIPEFPPLPILFTEKAPGEGLTFHCRSGTDLVGPNQFAAVRFDKPLELIFGPAVAVGDNLGIAWIPLIIAGIVISASATTVAYVAVEASKDKALAQAQLDAQLEESKLRRFLAEARIEFQKDCRSKGGTIQECAAASKAAAEELPKDFNKLGDSKFGFSSKLTWLFGGGLAVLGVLGGGLLYLRKRQRDY